MSLESKHFVATLEDVAAITQEVLDAQKHSTEGRATYLRALIATTQAELGENPRRRTASIARLSAEESEEQLKALEAVGLRFYGAVVRIAKERIEGPDRGGLQLNKRTGFARSSLSTIRKWVRVGNDITGLVASRITKRMLALPGRRRGPSAKVLGNRTTRFAERLEETLAALAVADKEAAVAQWDRLKARIERSLKRNGVARTGRSALASLRQAAA